MLRKIAISTLSIVFIFIKLSNALAWSASDPPISYSLFATVNTYPYQMAIDSNGNVYATITGDSVLSKFDSSGNLLTSFGTAFSGPSGVAIASNGNVYIANTQQDKIEIYTSSGSLVSTFGSTGSGNNQFSAPYSIDFDSTGNIYIADAGNNRVQKFNSSLTYLSTITGYGSAFNYPEAVAIDFSDNLYVLDSTNNRVQMFNSGGTFVRTITGSSGAWNYPEGMTVDSSGNLYVADSGNDRIQIFNSDGVFQQSFGSSGTSLGQFQYAVGLAITDTGILYIGDQNRIQKVTFDRTPAVITISGLADNVISGTAIDALSVLTAIQFSVDSGSYQSCTANDGAIDELSENFQCNLNTIFAIGQHTINVRSTDSKTNTNTGSNLGSYSFTLNPNPKDPPKCNLTAPKISPIISKIDRNLGTAVVSFLPIENSENYVIEYGSYEFGQYALEFSENYSIQLKTKSVNFLDDNLTYYFRIRGGNNCATGLWSNWYLSAGNNTRQSVSDEIILPSVIKEPIPNATPTTIPTPPITYELEVFESMNTNFLTNNIKIIGTTGVSLFLIINFIFTTISITTSLSYVYKNSKRSKIYFPFDFSFAMIGYVKNLISIFPFFRRKTGGVVFDALSGKPIENALMLFFSDSGNLKSTYSEFNGKYQVSLNPDVYKLRIDKKNYIFPSNFIKVSDNGVYTNIYIHPEIIPVTNEKRIVNHFSIPLDPIK